MSVKDQLVQLALACGQASSMRLRTDAATLLKLAQQLDEHSAAIYLHRFCQKWGLDAAGTPAAAQAAVTPMVARRAPQGDELASQVEARLEQEQESTVEVRFEGIDDLSAAS